MVLNDVVDMGFDLSQILGKPEAEVIAVLTAANRKVRVEFRDGKPQPHTLELATGRVNLNIVDGLVSSYRLG